MENKLPSALGSDFEIKTNPGIRFIQSDILGDRNQFEYCEYREILSVNKKLSDRKINDAWLGAVWDFLAYALRI